VRDVKTRTLDNFFVRCELVSSDCGEVNLDSVAKDGGKKSAPATFETLGNHLVEVENLTTVPFDVQVMSTSPDASEGFLFSVNDNNEAGWTASFRSLLDLRGEQSCILLQRIGTNTTARVHTTGLKYKKPIWADWEEQTIDPILELAIKGI
jgi:hypothetical protein